MADTRSDEQKAKDAEKMLGILQQIRQPYEEMIDNVITFVNHSRRKIKDKDGIKGQKTGQQQYDGTALSALNLLTDGLCGYSASKSFRWFNYILPGKLNFPRTSRMRMWSGRRLDEYPQVKQWLEDVEEVQYSAFLRSNFYDIFPEIVRDAASIGTVTSLAEEDIGSGRIVFTVPHFRECYLAEDRFGTVDTNYRVYNLTLRQLVDKFGEDKISKVIESFKIKYENNPHQEVEIIHAMYPRRDYDKERLDSKNKPYASDWYLRSPIKLIEESGYDDKPFLTWRWRKNNDEICGRSPSWDAYVDIMTGHQQAHTNLKAGHRMADPPMIAPGDLRQKVQKDPGGWTFMDTFNVDKLPKPLMTGIQLPYAVDQEERTDKKIREHYHVDFFLMISQAAFNKVEMTAYQVFEMSTEKAAILGTRIGRMDTELLNPTHDRMFQIEWRAGRIPEAPQILLEYSDGNIEVDYLGPLAQAQKRAFKSQVIRAGLQVVGETSSIYDEAKLVIDPIRTLRDFLESSGFPIKNFRTDKEIEAILKVKEDRRATQEIVEGVEKVGKAFPGVGKAIEKGSPVDMLMGGEEGEA